MHSQVPGRNGLYRSKKCPQVVFKRIMADTAQRAIAQPCPPAGLGQRWILECGHSNPAMGHLGKHREVLSISRNRQRARERPAEPTVQSRITLYKQQPRRPSRTRGASGTQSTWCWRTGRELRSTVLGVLWDQGDDSQNLM